MSIGRLTTVDDVDILIESAKSAVSIRYNFQSHCVPEALLCAAANSDQLQTGPHNWRRRPDRRLIDILDQRDFVALGIVLDFIHKTAN